MTLDEYIKYDDPNKFWRLGAGEVQNLLDEAIERIEQLKQKNEEIATKNYALNKTSDYGSLLLNYIDRLDDPVPSDNLEKIVSELVYDFEVLLNDVREASENSDI